MPARYHEGARKAYNLERMIREQIKRKKGPRSSKVPKQWTRFERMAKTKKKEGLIKVSDLLYG